jgi:hypothetical protein
MIIEAMLVYNTATRQAAQKLQPGEHFSAAIWQAAPT